MKKLFSVILACALTLSAFGTIAYAEKDDDEVPKKHSSESDVGEKIDEKIKHLQEKIDKLQGELEKAQNIQVKDNNQSKESEIPVTLVYAALGVSGLSLLLALIALFRTLSLESGISKSKKNIDRIDKKIDQKYSQDMESVEIQLDDIKKEFYAIKDAFKTNSSSRKSLDVMEAPSLQGQNGNIREIPVRKPLSKPVYNRERDYQDFVDAYNEMQQKAGANAMLKKEMREKLASKFSIRAFSCINYSERMNNPSVPLTFADESVLVKAQYWAFALQDGTYAVVPNIKSYEDRIHRAAGMKEAFSSNYKGGSTYELIIVMRPAIFSANWTIEEKGELQLR